MKKLQKRTINIKTAIVCEPLYKMGGAELHLQYIMQAFPNHELFTAYYNEEFVKKNFPSTTIHTSKMQKLPNIEKFRNQYIPLLPKAYQSFDFTRFDVVISLSSSFAKFVQTKDIPHIDICMTPPRFLWNKEIRTIKNESNLKTSKLNSLSYSIYNSFIGERLEDNWRKMDIQSAQRCTKMIAISNVVKERIKDVYKIDSDVIYPPVNVTEIEKRPLMNRKEDWFLYLGRVETYKGVELAIRACAQLNLPLKIAGDGQNAEAMKELVKKMKARGYIKFLGFVSDEEKYKLLERAKAVIFPVQDEDFGIVPVEANASGTPVVAYRSGGVTETISEENPKTGVFFDDYTVESLAKVLKNFSSSDYNQDNCRKQAELFAEQIFVYKLQNYVKDVLDSQLNEQR